MTRNRGGRPRKPVPRNAVATVAAAAATGANMPAIAAQLGVGKDLLRQWLAENPAMQEAFEVGRERERRELHGALYQQAMKGNTVAAIFLLKARHGYQDPEANDGGQRVNVTVNLPGAMSPEQYANTINVKAGSE